MKNELEQREGLLLPVPRRIAVLSSANNSREIEPPDVCGYIDCVHLRSLPVLCRPAELMNCRNKDSVMQSLSVCSANLPGVGAFTCLWQRGQEWRGESGCCGQQQGDHELAASGSDSSSGIIDIEHN